MYNWKNCFNNTVIKEIIYESMKIRDGDEEEEEEGSSCREERRQSAQRRNSSNLGVDEYEAPMIKLKNQLMNNLSCGTVANTLRKISRNVNTMYVHCLIRKRGIDPVKLSLATKDEKLGIKSENNFDEKKAIIAPNGDVKREESNNKILASLNK